MHKEFNRGFDKWLEESDQLVLNEEDWNRLMYLLDNPPPPNDNLKKAMKRYKELSNT